MNNLEDWLRHLEGLHPKGQAGIELGLERIRRVKATLGQKQDCPVIIVGGTNGKGSTCAYLENIIARAGYRVGCYTSPHLLTYNERVRLNGKPVGDDALCAAFARVEAARQQAGEVALTYFEFGTLAAWEAFASKEAVAAGLAGAFFARRVEPAVGKAGEFSGRARVWPTWSRSGSLRWLARARTWGLSYPNFLAMTERLSPACTT